MKTQSLKHRVKNQQKTLEELARQAEQGPSECGRDTQAIAPHEINAVNWNKGWGKYGKT